jgi:L-asparaginase II
MPNQLPILAEVTRGSIVESRHRGAILIAEPDGTETASLGDPDLISSTRSTIKPIQALPFITSGAADHFNASPAEIAVASASHEGEPIHVETVSAMLARAGLDESALGCGPQVPYNADAARELERQGLTATQLHNNCSGKHTAMLLTARHRGLPIDGYYKPEHPIQQAISVVFRQLALLTDEPPIAIDGCSAPTFGVALRSIARAFARLVNTEAASDLTPEVKVAARRVISAMIAHPEMVGGTKGRFDTELLRAANGKLVCKIGAEAVYAIGVLPCERYPRGLGIAIKMEDGSYRGLGPVVVETLGQLGVLEADEIARLATYHRPAIESRRGVIVGEVRPNFVLESR